MMSESGGHLDVEQLCPIQLGPCVPNSDRSVLRPHHRVHAIIGRFLVTKGTSLIR